MLNVPVESIARRLHLGDAVRWGRRARATDRVPYDHAYHCCTPRTASRWFRAVLTDPAFYNRTGLEPFLCRAAPQRMGEAAIPEHLPRWTAATPLYTDYRAFLDAPKSAAFRAFFILRDPRDVVVSWYDSMTAAPRADRGGERCRDLLRGLDGAAGLRYCIDYLGGAGLFDAQRSWVEAAKEDGRVTVLRYERLAGDATGFVRQLFNFLEVLMPLGEREALAARHPFARYADGKARRPDTLSLSPPSRNDWTNRFTKAVDAHFRRATGGLAEKLGYPRSLGEAVIRPRLAA